METENNKEGFVLQGIKTEQFAIFEENYTHKKEVVFITGLQFKVDSQNKQIGTFLTFEFAQGKKVFLKIQVSCHFKIKENTWESFIQEEKLLVPKSFLAELTMMTTGTTRGILFAKTEGTAFSKYIIPSINVAEIIDKDGVFNFE